MECARRIQTGGGSRGFDRDPPVRRDLNLQPAAAGSRVTRQPQCPSCGVHARPYGRQNHVIPRLSERSRCSPRRQEHPRGWAGVPAPPSTERSPACVADALVTARRVDPMTVGWARAQDRQRRGHLHALAGGHALLYARLELLDPEQRVPEPGLLFARASTCWSREAHGSRSGALLGARSVYTGFRAYLPRPRCRASPGCVPGAATTAPGTR